MDSPTFSEDEEQEHSMESMDGRKDEETREEEKKEEKEEVDEMPENHFKMVAFHAAIKAVLERQVEKLQLEVNESKRLVDVGEKESEEFAKELHEEQRGLVLEEDVVRNSSKKLERKQNKRERREFENRNYRSEAEKLEEEIEVKSLQNSSLRSKVNDLTGENLHLKVSRLDVENELGVEQACTDKGERDFKRAQEAKLFQDKYVGQLLEEVEELENLCVQYQVQAVSMDSGTVDTMENVRRAEGELLSVKSQVNKIVANWTNTVININKRDEALTNFQEAIDFQKLELKTMKTKIESIRSDIVDCQVQHEQMTGIHKRVQRLALQHQTNIKKLDRIASEEKLELGRLGRVRNETEEVLAKTEAAVKEMEAEESNLKMKVEKADIEKRNLEEELLGLMRDQASTERSSNWTDRSVKEIQGQIKEIDIKQVEANNRRAELEGNIAIVKLKLEEERQRTERLKIASKTLVLQESETTSGLEKTIKSIDRIQNLIDIGTKQAASLLAEAGGEEMTPLEAEIRKTKEELNRLSEYCANSKRQWTKMQNILIKSHVDKEEYKQESEQCKNKFNILEEKKISIEKDIQTLEIDLSKLKKRIDNFDKNIKKLNTIVCEERVKLESTEESRIIKNEERVVLITDLENSIENLKESVRKLEISRHFTVEKLRESDRELFDWEDKVKACKETSGYLTENRGQDSEIENLKCEVHFLDQKLKDLDRATAELTSSFEEFAIRRESIYEKINAEKAVDLEKKKEKMGKTLTAKKILDLQNTNKQMSKEIRNFNIRFQKAKSYLVELNSRITDLQSIVQTVSQDIRHIGEEIVEAQNQREISFSSVIQVQQKVKWYQAIKNKQYRCLKVEDAVSELSRVEQKNQELREGIVQIQQQFPQLQPSLRRVVNGLVRVKTGL